MRRTTEFRELNPVIPVKNMNETLAFYEEKLGFRRAFDDSTGPETPISYAGVLRGGLCLHLQSMAPDENPTMPLIRIRVDNIEPLYEEYKNKGALAPNAKLEPKPWGSKDFGLYDPNGAALLFYEDL